MSKWIENRPDNCPDQPRFEGGVIGMVIGVFLFWAAAAVILSFVIPWLNR